MKAIKRAAVWAACIVCLWVPWAQADLLSVGGNYTHPVYLLNNGTPLTDGGGSVEPSYLNGNLLGFLYCVDPWTVVYPNTNYNNTVVTTNGVINGAAVNNAGQIAWLLTQYGAGGQGDQAYALQAAIWHVVDPNLTIDPTRSSANQVNLYNTYLATLGTNTGDVGAFLWISPAISGSSTKYQGLVAPGNPVPIPAALWLLASGLIGVIGIRRKFAK